MTPLGYIASGNVNKLLDPALPKKLPFDHNPGDALGIASPRRGEGNGTTSSKSNRNESEVAREPDSKLCNNRDGVSPADVGKSPNITCRSKANGDSNCPEPRVMYRLATMVLIFLRNGVSRGGPISVIICPCPRLFLIIPSLPGTKTPKSFFLPRRFSIDVRWPPDSSPL